MGLIVKDKQGPSIPPVPNGTYTGICVGIVDLGEQYSEAFKKFSEKILIIWELPNELMDVDGEKKPRWLSKAFSKTLNKKSALVQMLVPWRGRPFTEEELKGFDLQEMLGLGCLMQVVVEENDDRQYNKITSIIGLPTGMPQPTPINTPFSFDMDAWDDTVFDTLPGWVQDRIKKSTQYQKNHVPTVTVDFDSEEAPKQAGTGEACPI